MRKLVLLVALLGLSSCAALQQGGEALCAAQTEAADVITRAGNLVGVAGVAPLIADSLNLALEFFCVIIDAGLSAPADVGDMLGVTEAAAAEGEDG